MSSWTSVATPQPPRRFPSQNRGVLTIALPVTTRICNRIIAVYFKINSSIFAQYWLGKINAHVTNGDSLKTKMGVVLKYEKYERFDPVFCLLGHHSKTSDGGSLALILLLRISHQLSIFWIISIKIWQIVSWFGLARWRSYAGESFRSNIRKLGCFKATDQQTKKISAEMLLLGFINISTPPYSIPLANFTPAVFCHRS